MICTKMRNIRNKRIMGFLLITLTIGLGIMPGDTAAITPKKSTTQRLSRSSVAPLVPLLNEGRIEQARKKARQTVYDHFLIGRLLQIAPVAQHLIALYGMRRFMMGSVQNNNQVAQNGQNGQKGQEGPACASCASSSSSTSSAASSGNDPKTDAEKQTWSNWFSSAGTGIKDWAYQEYNDWTSLDSWKKSAWDSVSWVGGAAYSVVNPYAWGKQACAMGKMVPVIATHAITGTILGKIQQKINHPDTILWYRDTQTSYVQSISDVITYAERITGTRVEENMLANELGIVPQCATSDNILSRKLLVRAAQELVYQVEKIIGYIDYKSAHFKRDKALTTRIKDIIRIKTNTLITECNTALSALRQGNTQGNTNVSRALTVTLKRYRDMINTLIDDFARLSTGHEEQHYNRVVNGYERSLNLGRRIERLPDTDKQKVAEIVHNYERRFEHE